MNNDATSAHTIHRKTWVVLCTPVGGAPFPAYVEGTALECSGHGREIRVLDGDDEVRRFPAGTWLNYAEWVTTPNWFAAAAGMHVRGVPHPR